MIYFFSSGRTALKHNQGFMQNHSRLRQVLQGDRGKKKLTKAVSTVNCQVMCCFRMGQISWKSDPGFANESQLYQVLPLVITANVRKETLVQSSACRVPYHLRASACVCRCFSGLNLPGESSASQQKPAEVKVIWFGSYYGHFTSSISVIIADWSRLLYREGS